jgi:3-oxoacyl-[acyl-carrier-protein] synthase II
VVITGLGPVSSIGVGAAAFGTALREGRSGISPIRGFDATGFPHFNAGEVHGFRPEEILRRLEPSCWGRSSLFAAAAARLAVTDAGLDLDAVDPDRVAVAMGTTCGETQVMEDITAAIVRDGFEAMPAELVGRMPAIRLAHAVSEELAACGESVTIATACAASNYALGYAYDTLASGEADVVVAGGAESVCRFVHAGFYRLGVLTEKACAPFDRNRDGILTAEGGSALVLETLQHATARGARPYAELLGYGLNCDAHHMVAAEPASIAECMRLAHRNAGVEPSEVDYISAHGTGTPANDSAEYQAVRAVFGERMPPVSSIKSMIGHSLGAIGAIEMAACALAIDSGIAPPTANWANRDPECDLDYTPNVARQGPIDVTLSVGSGFGGFQAAMIFGKLRETGR